MIYLDHNATTPIRPDVIALVTTIMGEVGNAMSTHQAGQKAAARVERAREQIAAAVNTRPAQVIFTGSATESMATILKTFKGQRILASAVEHAAVLESGLADLEIIPVDSNGIIDLRALEDRLKTGAQAALLNLMMVNNETGVIQPVKQAIEIAHAHNTLVHVDAVQALGKIPVDFRDLGADYMSLSAHKIGGPQGVGCFIFGAQKPIRPLIMGGKQEKRQRAGTSNVAGIAGFGLAAQIAVENMPNYQKLADLRDHIETTLAARLPGITVNGQAAPRVANTISLTCKGVSNTVQMMQLDLAGICVSQGAACSSGVTKPSHVLLAMGLSEDHALSTLRISLGYTTTAEDVDQFIQAYIKMVKE